jgi:hypothetical protein
MSNDAMNKSNRSLNLVRCFGASATANGSTDTAVARFVAANITLGSSFTLVETAAEGTVLTCVRSGLWAMRFAGALAGTGNLQIAIGVNAAAAGAFTTSPTDFAVTDAGAGAMGIVALAGDTSAAAEDGPHVLECSATQYLALGDTLRFYATAAVALDTNNSRFFLNPISLDV